MQAILLLLATSSVSIATALPIAFPKGGGGKPGGGGGSTSSTSGKPGKPSSPKPSSPKPSSPNKPSSPAPRPAVVVVAPVSPPSSSSGRGSTVVYTSYSPRVLTSGALAGIIIGSIVFILLVILLIYFLQKRSKSRAHVKPYSPAVAAVYTPSPNSTTVQTTTVIYPGQYPKPGSFLSSFNNASEAEFEAGAQFQRLFPTSIRNGVTPEDVAEISRVGPQQAWLLEFEAGNGVSGMIENLANGGGGQILTFSKPATTVSLLSRLPLHIDPYTPGRNWFYFEVTIMEITISPNPTVISIGLATKPYPPFRHIGWNQHSIGYHSDDGRAFHDDPFGGRLFATSYTRGDTIGCGYDPNRGAVFYTLNGTHLGDGSLSNTYRDYHVAVAADGPCQVYVNVGGKPFLYSSANVGCLREREVKV